MVGRRVGDGQAGGERGAQWLLHVNAADVVSRIADVAAASVMRVLWEGTMARQGGGRAASHDAAAATATSTAAVVAAAAAFGRA